MPGCVLSRAGRPAEQVQDLLCPDSAQRPAPAETATFRLAHRNLSRAVGRLVRACAELRGPLEELRTCERAMGPSEVGLFDQVVSKYTRALTDGRAVEVAYEEWL
ncbi:hypothetical protein VTK73DRAFT_9858 [Phialemonium thermophilum]|uniref:Uncharacterized protein n=1 Tax=Phialemonium thermophilum TaxID=223376 RepID=A0ABR3XJQ0_9PEZI